MKRLILVVVTVFLFFHASNALAEEKKSFTVPLYTSVSFMPDSYTGITVTNHTVNNESYCGRTEVSFFYENTSISRKAVRIYKGKNCYHMTVTPHSKTTYSCLKNKEILVSIISDGTITLPRGYGRKD
jgi:hypothetical protein